ncbi:hypothetical protein CEUSTIGMA_g7623.t1 [Chlamydomonas eustigma]|uniref:Methionine aminopeptidase n=1 Tax=Chlamydomonas eustigma TaxID=1157962 RepID=A0A250XAQ8_9CHLO|nr:hypothetical protein CEUSTIGMA_g7623.t1 [Chlamydomonas eustigma]|eukprot:GAX80185.1 hypothetical protein CEUSTIGMA_g7623.t1 [Chlamydomonas eustigma]
MCAAFNCSTAVMQRQHFARLRSSRTVYSGVLNMAKGFGFALGPKMINKKSLLVPRKISPKLPIPANIKKPPYGDSGVFPPWGDMPQIQGSEGMKRMRASGKLAAQVLQYAGSIVKPGVTTDEIDRAVHKMIVENGAYPSPLNYGGFPKSVCTSVNECVCHGIPDDRPLEEGDIVNIDVTVYLNGYHGDTSSMFLVGPVSDEAKKLCEVTKHALDEAIKICKEGVPYREIGSIINGIADQHKFGVIRDYVGHGVGQQFHSAPTISHFRNNSSGTMKLWQTFTIEPMLVQGSTKCKTWKDKWTVVTEDGGLAAQYEHTILITPDGAEILTKL